MSLQINSTSFDLYERVHQSPYTVDTRLNKSAPASRNLTVLAEDKISGKSGFIGEQTMDFKFDRAQLCRGEFMRYLTYLEIKALEIKANHLYI
ncbi:MAG: hypothetical protein ACRC62_08140 [Microcoleus sp.]